MTAGTAGAPDATRLARVALVVEGGGMRGFYGAGALACLRDHGVVFPYVIGNSSGALNAVRYVADAPAPDFAALARVPARSLLNPRGLVRPHEGLLSINALLRALVRDACDRVAGRGTLLVPATDALTGDLVWWDVATCATGAQVYERVVASSSIPVVMPLARVDGRVCADGGIRDSIPVLRALADGRTRAVLILSRPRGYRKAPQHLELYLRAWLRPYPRLRAAMLARHLRYNESMALVERMEDAGDAFALRPTAQRVARFQYAPDKFRLDFQDGYQACERALPALLAFVGRA